LDFVCVCIFDKNHSPSRPNLTSGVVNPIENENPNGNLAFCRAGPKISTDEGYAVLALYLI